MHFSTRLEDADTLVDVGAGWTELDFFLRQQGWMGRYFPVDGGLDGVDLNGWRPPRHAEWFVALEILEHLDRPMQLLGELQAKARKGVIVSTPNPETTDVLGMDQDHRTAVHGSRLRAMGLTVTARNFYGKADDSLFGVWLRDGHDSQRLANAGGNGQE